MAERDQPLTGPVPHRLSRIIWRAGVCVATLVLAAWVYVTGLGDADAVVVARDTPTPLAGKQDTPKIDAPTPAPETGTVADRQTAATAAPPSEGGDAPQQLANAPTGAAGSPMTPPDSTPEAILDWVRASWSHDGIEVISHPNGRTTVRTSGRFLHLAAAHLGADGTMHVVCGTGPADFDGTTAHNHDHEQGHAAHASAPVR